MNVTTSVGTVIALAAAVSAWSADANAAIINSVLNVPGSVSINRTSGAGNLPTSGLFSDTWNVNVTGSGGGTTVVVDIDAPPLSQIDNFQAVLTGPGPIGPISVTSAQSFAAITGLYSIAISGSIPRGTINAQYAGNFNVVPLPGAALLFGTAIAGLAWMRRRRDGGLPAAAAA